MRRIFSHFGHFRLLRSLVVNHSNCSESNENLVPQSGQTILVSGFKFSLLIRISLSLWARYSRLVVLITRRPSKISLSTCFTKLERLSLFIFSILGKEAFFRCHISSVMTEKVSHFPKHEIWKRRDAFVRN